MKAARYAPALCGGKPTDLVADPASHQSNFLATRLNGTENPSKRPAIRRMSVDTTPDWILRNLADKVTKIVDNTELIMRANYFPV